MSEERDDELAPWCAALAARRENDIARYAAVPDFEDVLARMQQPGDGSALPESFGEPIPGGLGEADVVPLARARALSSTADPALAPFVDALRERVEHGLREHALAAIPSLPAAAGQKHLRWAVGAILAVAAAGVLWLAAAPLLITRDHERPANEAVQSLGTATDSPAGEAQIVTPKPSRPRPATDDAAVPETPTAPPERPSPPTRSHAQRSDDLDALEREADTAWAAGDLEQAERALRRVIGIGGRSHRVELAYGDLFALSRQRHGEERQRATWREYLRKFPRGRFADDARAGICRSDKAEIARECWRGYIESHPDGSHVAEARRRLAGEGGR